MDSKDLVRKAEGMIEQMQMLIDGLNKSVEEHDNWPQVGDSYWTPSAGGKMLEIKYDNDNTDKHQFKRGRGFRTEEECQAKEDELDAIALWNERILELNGDWVCDWNDPEQVKCLPAYSHDGDNRMVPLEAWTVEPTSPFKPLKDGMWGEFKAMATQDEINKIWGL